MLPTEFMIALSTPLRGDFWFGFNPDCQVECALKFWVEQSNAVDYQYIGNRQRLRVCQFSAAPVEALERARLRSTEWGDHFPQQTNAVDAVPISGAVVGTRRVQEVVAPDASGAVNARQEFSCESGLSGARVP